MRQASPVRTRMMMRTWPPPLPRPSPPASSSLEGAAMMQVAVALVPVGAVPGLLPRLLQLRAA